MEPARAEQRLVEAAREAAAIAKGRDWSEDFSHENGRYVCICYRCGQQFQGHKRRVCCKVCAQQTMEARDDGHD